jgi:hypothetical protein
LTMYGACSETRAAVAESEGGSGLGNWASLCTLSAVSSYRPEILTWISFLAPSDRFEAAAAAVA